MKRRFTMFVVVVASACNRTQPSEPTYVPSPVQLVTRHFSGVVLSKLIDLDVKRPSHSRLRSSARKSATGVVSPR